MSNTATTTRRTSDHTPGNPLGEADLSAVLDGQSDNAGRIRFVRERPRGKPSQKRRLAKGPMPVPRPMAMIVQPQRSAVPQPSPVARQPESQSQAKPKAAVAKPVLKNEHRQQIEALKQAHAEMCEQYGDILARFTTEVHESDAAVATTLTNGIAQSIGYFHEKRKMPLGEAIKIVDRIFNRGLGMLIEYAAIVGAYR